MDILVIAAALVVALGVSAWYLIAREPRATESAVLSAVRRNLTAFFWRFWPPYLGAGILIKRIAPDWRAIDVEMRLHFWNRNVVRTHFGGSLYSMTDPFFMAIMMHGLGKDYIVWDKAATIRFRRPGKGRVHARFEIGTEEIERVRALADKEPKVEPTYFVKVLDEGGHVVAEVEKLLYVRRKDRARTDPLSREPDRSAAHRPHDNHHRPT